VDGGRDGALRRPRPRFSGRPECGESGVGRGLVPSPDAPLGDGDSAARYPYPSVLPGEEYDMKTNWNQTFHLFRRGHSAGGGADPFSHRRLSPSGAGAARAAAGHSAPLSSKV